MKAKSYKGVLSIGLMILLTGCSSARDIVGLSKQSPDEFEVVTRAPLSLPPIMVFVCRSRISVEIKKNL